MSLTISSVRNPISARKHNTKNLSFKAHYDCDNLQEMGDGFRYKNVEIHNYTELLRDEDLFKELPSFISKRYPNGVKIYDYACSTGHEAGSIIIGILGGMKNTVAKKYLPIEAYDKNPKIIAVANKHKIELEGHEFRVIKSFDNLKIGDYYEKLYKTDSGQILYQAKDVIKNNVKFSVGDIFKDSENGKFSKKPCVVFFRNAWQFLTANGTKEIAESLYKNMCSGSTLIIGDMDDGKILGFGKAKNALLDAGFQEVEATHFNLKDFLMKLVKKEMKSSYLSTHGFIRP